MKRGVRTRSGGSQTDRVRPTASVRWREWGGTSNIVVEDDVGGNVREEVNVVEPQGYPGGPFDTSLLVSYEDHIAMQLWNGVVSNYIFELIFCFWLLYDLKLHGWCRTVLSWNWYRMK